MNIVLGLLVGFVVGFAVVWWFIATTKPRLPW